MVRLPQNQRKSLVDEPDLWYFVSFKQLNRIGFCFAFNVELGDTKMKVGRLSLITGIISSVLILQGCAQVPVSKPVVGAQAPVALVIVRAKR